MTQFIIRRMIHSLFVVWGCATLVFFGLRAVPGDPVTVMLGQEYTPEAADALRKKLGLDQPLHVQYVRWFSHIMQGDLGRSIATDEPVTDAVRSGLPKTLSITLFAFVFGLIIAIPAGTLAALRRDGPIDYAASIATFVGISLPPFWFGIVFILIFAVRLDWLPSLGYASLSDGVWEWFKHLILPGLAAGVGQAAILMRFVRAGLLEVMGSDYVRTARAKGLNERVVILRHAMRNSLIPVVTVAGLSLAGLLGGLVITETVFSIRGIGRILVNSIFNKDYPVVQGVILLIALIFVTANLFVDILYTFLDPRIRHG
jgi:peptide/nickel transport system permease protein